MNRTQLPEPIAGTSMGKEALDAIYCALPGIKHLRAMVLGRVDLATRDKIEVSAGTPHLHPVAHFASFAPPTGRLMGLPWDELFDALGEFGRAAPRACVSIAFSPPPP